jgi:hypothetical protein
MMLTFFICHIFGMSCACSNPVLYGFLNENFAKGRERDSLCEKNGPPTAMRGVSPNFHIHVSVSELYIILQAIMKKELYIAAVSRNRKV